MIDHASEECANTIFPNSSNYSTFPLSHHWSQFLESERERERFCPLMYTCGENAFKRKLDSLSLSLFHHYCFIYAQRDMCHDTLGNRRAWNISAFVMLHVKSINHNRATVLSWSAYIDICMENYAP